MKKIYIILLLSFNTVFAQISISDISELNNDELDLIKTELQQPNINSEADTAQDLIPILIEPMKEIETDKNEFFGYSYFKKDLSFFDNTPTPSDYKLGPGDEIIISLWGENNSRENFTINKDGTIYYKNVGFINLSNKTLESASKLLIEELSRIYSTLKDKNNPTKLMLELGKLKSINIYFSGNIENPGIGLVHPFSDIFSAVVQAGGVKNNGSLRSLQLIRNDKIISTVDFYSFFMDGRNNFSSIKLIDGDVIHIPNVKKRVSIKGEVNRPSNYELLAGESIPEIIKYSSGFTSFASSTMIISQIIPVEERFSDDNAQTSMILKYKNQESVVLNNGDVLEILPISSVDTMVAIYGRVKAPGSYPGVNTTLKNILDIAGGFDDPVYRKSIREDEIIILRQDSNQFYNQEISVSYKDANQIKLKPNDKIFVYEDVNYKNSFTYRFEGEVFKPGTYPLNRKNLTVREAILLAGGLTELTSERNLSVKQEYTELDEDGIESTTSETVNNITLDFEIGINSVIIASPFENVIRVEGNVYNPGLITYSKGAKLPRYIELAGGYKPNTIKNRVYIKRANGNIEQTNRITLGVGKKLYPGDTIIVPMDENAIPFDGARFTSNMLSILTNLVAIFAIADNKN